MEKFKVLEHTADLKIKFYGKDLAELFVNAALAVAKQQGQVSHDKKLVKKWESVVIQSADLNSLLINWLNEILSRSDLNKKIYFDFKIKKISENNLEAEITGQKADSFGIEIKAATYHDLKIKKVNNHWQAIVVFDI